MSGFVRGDRHCRNCKYYSGHVGSCDYMLMTNMRRPCDGGKDCTVKEIAGKRKAKMDKMIFRRKRIKWDMDKALELYHKGMTDKVIAEAVGTLTANIRTWRCRNGYAVNKKAK